MSTPIDQLEFIPTAMIRGSDDDISQSDFYNTVIGAVDMGYIQGSDNLPTFTLTEYTMGDE